jgi:hypothetical protein
MLSSKRGMMPMWVLVTLIIAIIVAGFIFYTVGKLFF